ncbi:acyl-CoA dehydrogenase [Seongchinamella unica]|uniref:Acyl-CoA dehydrogenase n=1 Tax=Seongchinamella unica TaxID=2547392 RepID=A0A4R5LTC6_9GAMM|nr:acyl-CoA dehydrogenase family protein [Seongchinamella unica]TDG14161.1 acyl-CoA dehydrogenase [Seongchinamella unica]
MDFKFSDDQNAIRELAYQIFTDRATDEFMLTFSRGDHAYDEQLWTTLAEQGLLGIAVPETAGGSGLGFTELCLVLEEQGRRVAPVPLFSSLVLGGLPLAEFGTADQQQLLASMSAGEVKLSAAVADLGMNSAVRTTVTASAGDQGWVLDGVKAAVPDGAVADYILVPAELDGQTSVFIVPTAADGVSLTPVEIGISGQRAAHLSLVGVKLDKDALLGQAGQGEHILDWLEQRANVAQCAQQVGVTEEAMKRTAAYVSERKQFGVPLGSFQALAMRMADSYIDVEAIRTTYWLALWRLSNGRDARAEVRAAKWWACDAAHRVVCTAQHLHGGMGADVEYPIHRFYLLAKQLSYTLGNGSQQLEKLGQLLAADDSLGFRALEV